MSLLNLTAQSGIVIARTAAADEARYAEDLVQTGAGVGAAARRRAALCTGGEGAAGRAACRSEDRRSLCDDSDDHADARADDLRPAVRLELEARAEAADGRPLRDLARPARLHLHPAPEPQIPRRPAGHDARRHRLLEALDGARCARSGDGPLCRGIRRDRRQDLRLAFEGALRLCRDRARDQRRHRARHHAREGRADRPLKNITETIGSGPFKFIAAEWNPGAKTVYEK